MHLFTEYALSTGSKLDRPLLLEKFYPLPFDKYITIQNSSGMPAKNYDYWIEVITLLKPILEKENIEIVHLGGKDDSIIPHTYRLCGATNLGQSTYLIKRSLAHIGNDSSLVHIASTLDKPIVALYGISPPKVCGPYFNKNSPTILLEPEFPAGIKYSYNSQEPEKYINTIKPENVINSILKILNLSNRVSLETLYIGKSYRTPIIEFIPDCIISPEQLPNQILNIRADILFNEDNIYQQVSVRKSTIVTNKPLNISALKQLKPNIDHLIIELTHDDIFDFVKELHKSTINYNLVTYADDDFLKELKFKYLDFNQIIPLTSGKKEDIKKEIPENTSFATQKMVLSKGKIYPSRAHYEAGIENQEENKIIDNEIFWDELEYFYLYFKN